MRRGTARRRRSRIGLVGLLALLAPGILAATPFTEALCDAEPEEVVRSRELHDCQAGCATSPDKSECQRLCHACLGFAFHTAAGEEVNLARRKLLLRRGVNEYRVAYFTPQGRSWDMAQNLALAYRELGEPVKGAKVLEDLALSQPGEHEALYLAAGDLYEEGGKKKKAARAYGDALRSAPHNATIHRRLLRLEGSPDGWLERSLALLEEGVFEVAREGFEQVIADSIDEAPGTAALALVYWVLASGEMEATDPWELRRLPGPERWPLAGRLELELLASDPVAGLPELRWWKDAEIRREAISVWLRAAAAKMEAARETERAIEVLSAVFHDLAPAPEETLVLQPLVRLEAGLQMAELLLRRGPSPQAEEVREIAGALARGLRERLDQLENLWIYEYTWRIAMLLARAGRASGEAAGSWIYEAQAAFESAVEFRSTLDAQDQQWISTDLELYRTGVTLFQARHDLDGRLQATRGEAGDRALRAVPVEERATVARYVLLMAMGLLDLDAVEGACETLERVAPGTPLGTALDVPGAELRDALVELLVLREETVWRSRAFERLEAALPPVAGTDPGFVPRQRFKVLVDVARRDAVAPDHAASRYTEALLTLQALGSSEAARLGSEDDVLRITEAASVLQARSPTLTVGSGVAVAKNFGVFERLDYEKGLLVPYPGAAGPSGPRVGVGVDLFLAAEVRRRLDSGDWRLPETVALSIYNRFVKIFDFDKKAIEELRRLKADLLDHVRGLRASPLNTIDTGSDLRERRYQF